MTALVIGVSSGSTMDLDRLRREVVSGLLPHVAHRINNRLMAAVGGIDLQRPGRSTDAGLLDDAIRGLRGSSTLLRELSGLSVTSAAEAQPVDLAALARGVHELVESQAHAARCALELRAPGPARVEAPPALARLLCAAALQLAAGGPEPERSRLAERPPGRIRGAVARARDHVELRVAWQLEGPCTMDRRFAREVLGLAAVLGARVREHATSRACALGFALRALDPPMDARSEDAATIPLLVVEPDETVGELIVHVLRDSGFAPVLARRAEAAGALLSTRDFAAVVCDARTGAALLASGHSCGPRAVWVVAGPHEAPPAGGRVLEQPFPPGELIDAVRWALEP